MEISTGEFILEEIRYQGFVRALPAELQDICPEFCRFLSPANWSMIGRGTGLYKAYVAGGDIELSITGAQRWAMLKSPHAQTLIRIYALQRLNKIYALQRLNKELNDVSGNSPRPRSNPSKETL